MNNFRGGNIMDEKILVNPWKLVRLQEQALKVCVKLSNLPFTGSVFEDVPWVRMQICDYTKGPHMKM